MLHDVDEPNRVGKSIHPPYVLLAVHVGQGLRLECPSKRHGCKMHEFFPRVCIFHEVIGVCERWLRWGGRLRVCHVSESRVFFFVFAAQFNFVVEHADKGMILCGKYLRSMRPIYIRYDKVQSCSSRYVRVCVAR